MHCNKQAMFTFQIHVELTILILKSRIQVPSQKEKKKIVIKNCSGIKFLFMWELDIPLSSFYGKSTNFNKNVCRPYPLQCYFSKIRKYYSVDVK